MACTATPAINPVKWWQSATLGECKSPFLNGAQRSVNRKVQGSNPWSGANCKFETDAVAHESLSPYILCTSFPTLLRLLGTASVVIKDRTGANYGRGAVARFLVR